MTVQLALRMASSGLKARSASPAQLDLRGKLALLARMARTG